MLSNWGLPQVKIIRFKAKCICTITAATVFALSLSVTLDTQQNGWYPFKIIWQQWLFVFKFLAC